MPQMGLRIGIVNCGRQKEWMHEFFSTQRCLEVRSKKILRIYIHRNLQVARPLGGQRFTL